MNTLIKLLTIFVAISTILAGISTFLQLKLNKYKTKVELYDRIKHFYDTTNSLFSRIIANNGLSWNDAIDYRIATSSAKFILKGNTKKYIEQIQSKVMQLAMVCMENEELRKSDPNNKFEESLHNRYSLIDWFQQQSNYADKAFAKHLDITH